MSELGFGLGLRHQHYEEIASSPGKVGWFEALSENYMVPGGAPLHWLDRIRRDYPVALHGVSLSIGTTDPIDKDYLAALKALAARVQPLWVSDHLCFTALRGTNMHDLLPLPYTGEALDHVVDRIDRVQDYLGRRLVLENVSSYVTYAASEMSEWDFIAELVRRADCEILLDVNNVFVSAYNHEFGALAFLRGIPRERVRQFHLAGHENNGSHIVDTHNQPIVDGVWQLYRAAVRLFPGVPTMIERDDNIPSYAELVAELEVARRIASEATHEAAA
jgi:uncharacterized protein (UPF0276 family)